jgi:hypothetical protein
MLILTLSCSPSVERCGSGDFYCNNLTSIFPYSRPVAQLSSRGNEVVLLCDGKAISRPNDASDTASIYDLKAICQAETICYVSLPFFWYEHSHFEATVVTSDKCCILRDFKTAIFEFGDSGPDSTRLINAVSAAMDENGDLYVVDSGDAYVKVFDAYGRFVGRFAAGPDPAAIKIKGYIYILNKADETIRQFDTDGRPTGVFLSSPLLSGITAFDLCGGFFVVADQGGARINIVTANGELFETKIDYCLQGANFKVGKIVNIEAGVGGFTAIDMDKNLIIHFSDYVWDISRRYY